MELTMGIMETYAENEDDVLEGHARCALRSGLSYGPAMGVKGTPPSALAYPAHTLTFIPSRPLTLTHPGFDAIFDCIVVGPESTEETLISKESPAAE
jgi:hypothetical protein